MLYVQFLGFWSNALMTRWIFLANFVCLVLLIDAIKCSQKRLLSLAYATGAFLLVAALGLIATQVLMPAKGSVVDVNEVLNKVGNAIQLTAPIAAVWAAHRPPRRVQS